MSDLVERLQMLAGRCVNVAEHDTCKNAIIEIERLRAEIRSVHEMMAKENSALAGEIRRLRAERDRQYEQNKTQIVAIAKLESVLHKVEVSCSKCKYIVRELEVIND